MKHLILYLLLSLPFVAVNGQALKGAAPIQKTNLPGKTAQTKIDQKNPILLSPKPADLMFKKVEASSLQEPQEANVQHFEIPLETSLKLLNARIDYLRFQLPLESKPLQVSMREVSILSKDFKMTNQEDETHPVSKGRFFQYESPDTLITLSVFANNIIGVFYIHGQQYILNKKDQSKQLYSFYQESPQEGQYQCGLPDEVPEDLQRLIQTLPNSKIELRANKVVFIYFEADYSMFQAANGDKNFLFQFIVSMFNNVSLIYSREGISLKISQIKFWEKQDPYSKEGLKEVLNDFKTYWNKQGNSFNGDLAHLLSFTQRGGGIALLNGVCSRSNSYSYSSLKTSFEFLPLYSWNITVIAHELGHNLGSPHTHNCVWQGGAIDNCSCPEDGFCPPGPTPTKGTLMSYCDLTTGNTTSCSFPLPAKNPGIDLNLGFGLQPGNLIRKIVQQSKCLQEERIDLSNPPKLVMYEKITIDPNPVPEQGTFKVSFNVANIGPGFFEGTIFAGVYDPNLDFYDIVGGFTPTEPLPPNYLFTNTITLSNPDLKLSQGNYFVAIFYVLKGSDESFFVESTENIPFAVPFQTVPKRQICSPPQPKLTDVGYNHWTFEWAPTGQEKKYVVAMREKNGIWSEDEWESTGIIWSLRRPCTEYEFRVKSICSNGESAWSQSSFVKTLGCEDVYCPSYGISFDHYISKVKINNLSHNSGSNYGYNNLSQLIATAEKGNAVNLVLKAEKTTNAEVKPVRWLVWVDFNQNLSFEDEGELVFEKEATNVDSVTAQFLIPSMALSGKTRIRVAMTLGTSRNSCAKDDEREVEDYSLLINNAVVVSTLNVVPGKLDVEAAGTEEKIQISATGSWTITSMPDWLNASAKSGLGNTMVSLFIFPNVIAKERSGEIVIQDKAAQLTTRLVITQKGGLIENLSITPDTLKFNEQGTIDKVMLSASGPWHLLEKPSWVSKIDPEVGDSSQEVTILIDPNTETIERTGLITFALNNSQKVENLWIAQQGKMKTGSLPLSWDIIETEDNHTITIPANAIFELRSNKITAGDYIGFFYDKNGKELCAGKSPWKEKGVAVAVFGDDPSTPEKDGFSNGEKFRIKIWQTEKAEELNVKASYAAINSSPFVTHTGEYAKNGASKITALTLESTGGVPESWQFIETEDNHTLVIPSLVRSDLNGANLAPGDYVGFFYDRNGAEICGGYGLWNGKNTAIPVYGDDATTTLKDGFASGEKFRVRVWQSSIGVELKVNVDYSPVGAIITHTNTFARNGFSQILKITSGNLVANLTIPLKLGWNTISSNILPPQSDFETLLAPIKDKVLILKNVKGLSVIPSEEINGIGSWNILEGYRIKVLEATSLSISGAAIQPELTPIPIRNGWQIIPFLNTKPSPPEELLKTINDITIIVKDNNGRAYIPSEEINGIGDLQPGQGYSLKALNNGTLIYPKNSAFQTPTSSSGSLGTSWGGEGLQHFKLLNEATKEENATLVFKKAALEFVLSDRDEIGVFNSSGILCAAGVYRDKHLGITLWGKDQSSAEQGFKSGEAFFIRIWKQAYGEEIAVGMVCSSGNARYQPNDLTIVDQILLNGLDWPKIRVKKDRILHVFPNPAKDWITIENKETIVESLKIWLKTPEGKMVHQWQVEEGLTRTQLRLPKVPTGLYFLEIQGFRGIDQVKIIIE